MPKSAPRGGATRTMLAAGTIVGAIALFAGIGVFAFRALPALPAMKEMQAASAAAAGTPGSAAVSSPFRDRLVAAAAAPTVTRNPAATEERLPAKVAPAATSDKPQRFKLAIIDSAGEINVRSRTLRLAHVDAPAADARCTNAGGREWPCGARARTALRRLVRARALDCRHRPAEAAATAAPAASVAQPAAAPAAQDLAPTETQSATCEVAGVDLGRWLVENGWASPAPGAPAEFASLHAKAKADRVGMYEPAAR